MFRQKEMEGVCKLHSTEREGGGKVEGLLETEPLKSSIGVKVRYRL